MDIDIKSILEKMYKPDEIILKKLEEVEERKYIATYIFPEYNRTINPFPHVSIVQIHAALVDTFIGIAEWLVLNKRIPISDDNLFEKYIWRSEETKCKKMINFEKEIQLNIEIKVENIEKFILIVYTLNGFIEGNVKCLLQK